VIGGQAILSPAFGNARQTGDKIAHPHSHGSSCHALLTSHNSARRCDDFLDTLIHAGIFEHGHAAAAGRPHPRSVLKKIATTGVPTAAAR